MNSLIFNKLEEFLKIQLLEEFNKKSVFSTLQLGLFFISLLTQYFLKNVIAFELNNVVSTHDVSNDNDNKGKTL